MIGFPQEYYLRLRNWHRVRACVSVKEREIGTFYCMIGVNGFIYVVVYRVLKPCSFHSPLAAAAFSTILLARFTF